MADTRKIYVAGEADSPLTSVTGKPVRIEDIRAAYNRDNPYTDPDFPAVDASIGDVGGDVARAEGKDAIKFGWARPYEICTELGIVGGPKFAVAQDSFSKLRCSANDIMQGYIGDCWYVAAVQALAKKPEELALVISEDNYGGFDEGKYCGAFHFRFYIMSEAKWVDVVVDDLIPTSHKPGTGEFCVAFAQVQTGQEATAPGGGVGEFWVALIEKAYAKLHGSYRGIEMGMIQQALENFCGGFGEYIYLKSPRTHGLSGQIEIDCLLNPEEVIKARLLKLVGKDSDAFVGLGSYGPWSPVFDTDGYKKFGLIGPHVYTILDAREVKCKAPAAGTKVLVQIRNPHGCHEWTGAFSDKDDASWAGMEEDLRTRTAAGSADIDEGTFWMELKDMIEYMNTLQISYYKPIEGTRLTYVKGIWQPELQSIIPDATGKPSTADLLKFGGYRFEVKQDAGGDGAENAEAKAEGKAPICFTLVLDGYNATYNAMPACYASLYGLQGPDEELADALKRGALCSELSQAREAGAWLFVDPGWYAIVPSLYTLMQLDGSAPFPAALKGRPIQYTLRVWTENEAKLEALAPPPPAAPEF